MALEHLQSACIPADPDPNALILEWQTAQAALGAPMPNPGQPAIHPIPASEHGHVAQLSAMPWVAPYLVANPGADFKLVEIDQLLAYQASVDNDRSHHHCHALTTPPSLGEMMHMCLPLAPPNDTFTLQNGPGQQSMLLRARSLNIRAVAQGFVAPGLIGVHFNHALPLSHVYVVRCFGTVGVRI
ncbi:hypothetical protein [Brevundimonas sp. TWP2-3-4b1]|uniref:hypothetical protein n=1 Tax=Brevundimonas sp. TWP2-3-4b1 TaxID=2804580 RepID=UPI003CFAC8E8